MSVGKGALKSRKNGPGGASTAIEPPGRFGGVVAIGSLLGPEPARAPNHSNNPQNSNDHKDFVTLMISI